MNTLRNTFTYRFPLIDIDDPRKIAAIVKRFEDEGLLLRVDIKPHSDYSAMCCVQYLTDESTTKEPFDYLKFLFESNASITIEIHIQS